MTGNQACSVLPGMRRTAMSFGPIGGVGLFVRMGSPRQHLSLNPSSRVLAHAGAGYDDEQDEQNKNCPRRCPAVVERSYRFNAVSHIGCLLSGRCFNRRSLARPFGFGSLHYQCMSGFPDRLCIHLCALKMGRRLTAVHLRSRYSANQAGAYGEEFPERNSGWKQTTLPLED